MQDSGKAVRGGNMTNGYGHRQYARDISAGYAKMQPGALQATAIHIQAYGDYRRRMLFAISNDSDQTSAGNVHILLMPSTVGLDLHVTDSVDHPHNRDEMLSLKGNKRFIPGLSFSEPYLTDAPVQAKGVNCDITNLNNTGQYTPG